MRAAAILGAAALLASCGGPKVDARGEPVTVGSLRLRTFPPGARVWIDGALKVESTPATLLLPAGAYRLVLQLEGAEALEKEIEIEAGEVSELNLNVPRPPDATLTVLSDALGAKVIVNGYTRGGTPVDRVVTRPGPIDLTVTSLDGHARSLRTHLRIGEQKIVELFFEDVACLPPEPEPPPQPMSLPPERGRLTLGLEPAGEVLDEREVLVGKTPLVDHPIEPGEHRLLLRSKDRKLQKWVTVEVEAGKAAIYRFRLLQEDAIE